MSDGDARLYELLGDIRADVGRMAERGEQNAEKLDRIDNRLTGYEKRLRTLESIADKGRGALKLILWIGGAATGLATMFLLLGEWIVNTARSIGKGG
ncbi:MAG: hypothetical protein ACOC91_03205 [bacterium]